MPRPQQFRQDDSENLRDHDSNLQLTIRWIPGHASVPGNENIDEEAKKAGRTPTPEGYCRSTCMMVLYLTVYQHSSNGTSEPSYGELFPCNMDTNEFMLLVNPLPKGHISLYTQLRTRHIPLNLDLHRIGKSPSSIAHTAQRETRPFITFSFNTNDTPVKDQVANALLRQATHLNFLLTEDEAYTPLMRYIKSTGRFKRNFW